MSKYTIELRKVIDLYGRDEVTSWFTNYCVFDYITEEQYNTILKANLWSKEKLARKIIDHYFMREIGLETPALFKHYVKVRLNEIMESKLPLIYTNSIQYDPLINVDYTEQFTRNIGQQQVNSGTSNETSVGNNSGLVINSNTPQGQISKEKILDGSYASNTSANENESTINNNVVTNGDLNSNTDETYTRRVRGNQGISASYQAMIKQFRENIVSIDKDIINELNDLFMGLY